jgi:hypothetical protein
MYNRRHRLGGTVGLIGLAIFSIGLRIFEIPRILPGQQLAYLLSHGIIIVALLALAPFYWKTPSSPFLNISVGILFMIYTLIGQWFMPLYVVAFVQALFMLSFIYQVPTKPFRALVVLWCILYCVVVSLRWERIAGQFYQLQPSDFYSIALSTLTMGLIAMASG